MYGFPTGFSSVSHRFNFSMRENPPQAVLSRMQLTLDATHRTPHGASRLVLAISAWSVKIRRAPSRHCRDARVDGRTTTATHDNEYTTQCKWSTWCHCSALLVAKSKRTSRKKILQLHLRMGFRGVFLGVGTKGPDQTERFEAKNKSEV